MRHAMPHYPNRPASIPYTSRLKLGYLNICTVLMCPRNFDADQPGPARAQAVAILWKFAGTFINQRQRGQYTNCSLGKGHH